MEDPNSIVALQVTLQMLKEKAYVAAMEVLK